MKDVNQNREKCPKTGVNIKKKPLAMSGFHGVKWARTIDLYDVNVTL